jgi:hypothetical protein
VAPLLSQCIKIQRRPFGGIYKATFGWLFFALTGLSVDWDWLHASRDGNLPESIHFKDHTMQFMLVFKEPEAESAKRNQPDTAPAYWGAWNAYIGAMGQAGIIVHGNGLQEPHTATQVQIRDGKRVIHDGPYADTKEHLGGYFIIEVPGLDDALEWAARSPNASVGSTEVRPVLVMSAPQ